MHVTGEDRVNQNILDRFRVFAGSGRLAHAYLLTGPRGSGKFSTAMAVARMLNCEADDVSLRPCGDCGPCRKIAGQNHPDVFLCDQGQDESIKIQTIRDVIGRMQLRPYEARIKAVIIRGVDLMTPEASNAFLKTLEEPSHNSLILLTTHAPDRLLDTVKSRCQMIRFFGAPRSRVTEYLISRGVSKDEAHAAAGFSEGCYERARQWQENGLIIRKNDVIDRFLSGNADEKFLKSLAAESGQAREALEFLMFYFSDMLLVKASAGRERLVNTDRADDLMKQGKDYSEHQVRDILDAIVNAKRMLDEKLNIKVPFMVLREKIWINNSYRYS